MYDFKTYENDLIFLNVYNLSKTVRKEFPITFCDNQGSNAIPMHVHVFEAKRGDDLFSDKQNQKILFFAQIRAGGDLDIKIK